MGIAKEHGHEFTADEWKSEKIELSEVELEGVAGGLLIQSRLVLGTGGGFCTQSLQPNC